MKARALRILGTLFMIVLVLHPWTVTGTPVRAAEPFEPPAIAQPGGGENLLINGDFDDPRYQFYHRPTNHFVGGMWYEWFAVEIPEFIDGGIAHHNVCYPPPPYGVCVDDYRNSSQGYIRWGAPFVAGVYQPVAVTPCHYYKFTAYNRNDAENYHPKIGIDPTGEGLKAYVPPDGDDLPWNCPPDGLSKCPNPGLGSPDQLPSHIVWSPEFEHASFTWAAQSLTVEAVSTTVTVWTYTAPEEAGSLSSYWDAMSLVETPPSSGRLVDGALPAPDGWTTGVGVVTASLGATLSWQTGQPAISQVLYHYVSDPAAPIATLASQFESQTTVDEAWTTSHQFKVSGLLPSSTYDYAILSHGLANGACQTSVVTGRFTTAGLVPAGTLPAPDGALTGLVTTTTALRATLAWQSSQASFGQVLYHYVANPAAPIATSTSQFESRTPVEATRATSHLIRIADLRPMSYYDYAILSCTPVNNLACQTSVLTGRLKTSDVLVPIGSLPTGGTDTVGLQVLAFDRSAYVIWQSARPSYAQVLYSTPSPVTPTVHVPWAVYLPMIGALSTNSAFTTDYAFRTAPDLSSSTLHVVQLSNLQPESWYRAAAVSAWTEGDQDKAAAGLARFRTRAASTLADGPTPDQLVKQLQDCLAGGKPLAACVDTVLQ